MWEGSGRRAFLRLARGGAGKGERGKGKGRGGRRCHVVRLTPGGIAQRRGQAQGQVALVLRPRLTPHASVASRPSLTPTGRGHPSPWGVVDHLAPSNARPNRVHSRTTPEPHGRAQRPCRRRRAGKTRCALSENCGPVPLRRPTRQRGAHVC